MQQDYWGEREIPMLLADADRNKIWSQRIKKLIEKNQHAPELIVQGRLIRMIGLTLEAAGCRAAVGDRCNIINAGNVNIECIR